MSNVVLLNELENLVSSKKLKETFSLMMDIWFHRKSAHLYISFSQVHKKKEKGIDLTAVLCPKMYFS